VTDDLLDKYNIEYHDQIKEMVHHPILVVMFITLLHPLFYYGRMLVKHRLEYLNDRWNLMYLSYVIFGMTNIVLQVSHGPNSFISQLVFITVILLTMMKTFFILRIIEGYSYIVTMLVNVISDLRVFLLFFTILMYNFSLILDIFGINKSDEY